MQNIPLSLASSFNLYQNYPNPFNPATKIKFDISESSFVKLDIYDITGRRVSQLVNKKLNRGTYEVVFQADEFSSGIYYYRLESAGVVMVKKMLLIK